MAKKTNISGTLILVALVAVAAIPKEGWILLGVAAAVYFLVKLLSQKPDKKSAETYVPYMYRDSGPPVSKVPPPSMKPRSSSYDEPVVVSKAKTTEAPSHRIPNAPKGVGQAEWIPPGQSVTIGKLTIPGGMVYVGTKLQTPWGGNDPCLINPNKPIASQGDYTERQFGYWPSYEEIPSTARRAYLEWLVGGRKDPEAEIGFVFLFFYGLERRAILDSAKNEAVRADWPAIEAETRRLLSIYSDNNSFRRYASELLNWVSIANHDDALYLKPIPSFPKTYELPLYIRLALGQAAAAGVPVPVDLALAWARLDPSVFFRTPAIRCKDEFESLFRQKYLEFFGSGIMLPKNKTKLKLVYQPASAGFRGYNKLTLSFGDIPDVSVLTGPVKKLQDLVDTVTKDLEPFSRYLGKNPDAKSTLEGLLQLPATLWPEDRLNALNGIKSRMGTGILVIEFGELQSILGAQSTLTRDKAFTLARVLESTNVGMEPDILGGAKTPKPEEKVVLFAVPLGEAVSRNTPAYQTAVLTLQLASAVAHADGDFSGKEVNHLLQQVQSWTHLTPNHLRRLVAQLRLLMVVPISLASLKKKLEPIDAASKQTLAAFMATVAQSDGVVTPEEVKMLEKVYKALGVEPKQVFSDVHLVATGGAPEAAPRSQEAGFKLDPARIAALQKDTEKVSALLSNIFQEEPVPPPEPELVSEEELVTTEPGIMGLDEQHSSLTRLLLSRPQWTRAELLDAASDLDLMLDGALEHINEATFDHFDMAFTEGDDPVEVNAEVLEKLEA